MAMVDGATVEQVTGERYRGIHTGTVQYNAPTAGSDAAMGEASLMARLLKTGEVTPFISIRFDDAVKLNGGHLCSGAMLDAHSLEQFIDCHDRLPIPDEQLSGILRVPAGSTGPNVFSGFRPAEPGK